MGLAIAVSCRVKANAGSYTGEATTRLPGCLQEGLGTTNHAETGRQAGLRGRWPPRPHQAPARPGTGHRGDSNWLEVCLRGGETPDLPQHPLRRLICLPPPAGDSRFLSQESLRGLRTQGRCAQLEVGVGRGRQDRLHVRRGVGSFGPRACSRAGGGQRALLRGNGRRGRGRAGCGQPATARHATGAKPLSGSPRLYLRGRLSVPKHLKASITKADTRVNDL